MKRFKLVVLVILATVLVSYLGLGITYYSYEPETSSNYLWAAYHVHSTYSDGLLSLPQIAEEARKSNVGLILLTDHGRPHPETSNLDKTIDGVRFIGGSEAGLPEGHINFFGTKKVPLFNLPPYPPDAFDDIREWGGFGVLTYPEDPREQWEYWEDDLNPDGIEIINITSYFRKASVWGKLATGLFVPFSNYQFMKDITPPVVALERWDELLKSERVLGLYACNAHGGFPLTKTSETTIPIPSYSAAFSMVGLGIDKKHESSPEIALSQGDFFSIIRGAGEPQKFDFHADLDGEIHPTGSSLSGFPELVLHVETEELNPRSLLKRDGKIIETARSADLRFVTDKPGVYRVEVYLDDHPFLSPHVPWILSNPIFVDSPFRASSELPICREQALLPFADLIVEKDEDSTASYQVTEDGAVLSYHLEKATPEKINRWVALALRGKIDLSPYAGFFIEATSEDYMRYQVEIRARENSYYSSFKLYPDRNNAIYVPFSKFYQTFGGREPIPLQEIDKFFITINTSSSRTGFSSALTIQKAGFCRLVQAVPDN